MTLNKMKLYIASGAAITLMMATLPTIAYTGQELANKLR